jgi:3-oxoacyl-[acyl-carrier-protein] synthase-1
VKLDLVITGVGSVTPIGTGALPAMHLIRCGLSRLALQPIPDRVGQWITGGEVPTFIPQLHEHRLERMARLAFLQAVNQAFTGPVDAPVRLGVLTGAPEANRPGWFFPHPAYDPGAWLPPGGRMTVEHSQTLPWGSCSAQGSLAKASEILARGGITACVIGTADSLLQLRIVRWLEDHRRLKCSYVNDGLMPGEAAGFLVVERAAAAAARHAPVLARVLSTAGQMEEASILTDQPNTAIALTRAVRTALTDAGLKSAELGSVWGDLNGESYRSREWAFSEVRVQLPGSVELIHPADTQGDLGNATDASLLALATMAQAAGWSGGRPSLVFSGSDRGIRAVTVLAPPTHPPVGVTPLTTSIPTTLPFAAALPSLGPDDEDPLESPDPEQTFFQKQLRQEYAGNIAALYYQRLALLDDGTLHWSRIAEPERRLLAHIDAVVAGGERSVWAVASAILQGEDGLCFAGAMTLAVLGTPNAFDRFEEALPAVSDQHLRGVTDALKHAPATPPLDDCLLRWTSHERPAVRAMALEAGGYRRNLSVAVLLHALTGDSVPVVLAAIEALSRATDPDAPRHLRDAVLRGQPSITSAAMLALTRIAPNEAAPVAWMVIRLNPAAAPAAMLSLAITGNSEFAEFIETSAIADSAMLQAAGVLGTRAAFHLLVKSLGSIDPSDRQTAARSLHLMTGADLRQTFESPLAADSGDGTVLNDIETTEEFSQSPADWNGWWTANASRFDGRTRYRQGKPFSLSAVIDELKGTGSLEQRRRASWELAILEPDAARFEPDAFVPHQMHILKRLEAGARAKE